MTTFRVPWKYFTLVLIIRPGSKVTAGIPANKNLIRPWLESKMKGATEEKLQELAAKTAVELPAEADSMMNVFKKDELGIYIEGRQLKSAFKEASNILREALQKQEAKDAKKSRFTNFRSKAAERLFVVDERIYFHRAVTGKLQVADAREERGISIITPQGPRNALKCVEVVQGTPETTLTCTLKYLDDGTLDADLIIVLLDYMGENGLGADRSQGSGRFNLLSLTEQL